MKEIVVHDGPVDCGGYTFTPPAGSVVIEYQHDRGGKTFEIVPKSQAYDRKER